MERWRSQTNLLTALFGILLFISPWLLGFSREPAGWNAFVSGAVLAAISIAAVVRYSEWEEWVDFVVGMWILASPWMLNYPSGATATKLHVLVGVIVTVLAAMELWQEHSPHVRA
jgi:hypothetical protein